MAVSMRMDTIFNAVSAYSTTQNTKDLKRVGTNIDDIKSMFASDRLDGTDYFLGKSIQELTDFKNGLVLLKMKDPSSAAKINDVIEKVNDAAGTIINRKYAKPETVVNSQQAEKEARAARREKKASRRGEASTSANPHEVSRTQTQGPSRSAIPSQAKSSKHSVAASKREATPTRTTTQTVDRSAPAPIREGREPKTRDEQVAVNIYMGTRVINMSDVKDKDERIAKMTTMAKQLPYSKTPNPGTFQGFLAQMYNNSYKALYG